MSVNLEQSLTFYWSFRKKDVHLVLGKKIKPGGELLLRSIPVFLLDECVNKEMGAGVVGPELKKKDWLLVRPRGLTFWLTKADEVKSSQGKWVKKIF